MYMCQMHADIIECEYTEIWIFISVLGGSSFFDILPLVRDMPLRGKKRICSSGLLPHCVRGSNSSTRSPAIPGALALVPRRLPCIQAF